MSSGFLERSGFTMRVLEDEREAGGVLDDVKRFAPELQKWDAPVIEVAKCGLPFYRDYELVRLREPGSDNRVLWGLYAPGDFWPLDASGRAIDSVNRLAPLSNDQDKDYLVFRRDPPSGPADHVPRVQPTLDVKHWTLLKEDAEERRVVLDDLKWSSRGAGTELLLRRGGTSFYNGHGLYELLLRKRWAATFHQFYFLHKPGNVWPLYGESWPIHKTNAEERLALHADEDVKRYLRFFCSAIRGDEGRFLLVERFREIPWSAAPPTETRTRVEENLTAIVLAASDSGGKWKATAAVLFGAHMSRAIFSISPDGSVEMLNDEPLITGLPVLDPKPKNFTENSDLSATDPQNYFDGYLAPETGEGTSLECDAAEFISLIEQASEDGRQDAVSAG